MNRWTNYLLIILLLTLLVPIINQLYGASPAFTTDNLLRGTMVSTFTP